MWSLLIFVENIVFFKCRRKRKFYVFSILWCWQTNCVGGATSVLPCILILRCDIKTKCAVVCGCQRWLDTPLHVSKSQFICLYFLTKNHITELFAGCFENLVLATATLPLPSWYLFSHIFSPEKVIYKMKFRMKIFRQPGKILPHYTDVTVPRFWRLYLTFAFIVFRLTNIIRVNVFSNVTVNYAKDNDCDTYRSKCQTFDVV